MFSVPLQKGTTKVTSSSQMSYEAGRRGQFPSGKRVSRKKSADHIPQAVYAQGRRVEIINVAHHGAIVGIAPGYLCKSTLLLTYTHALLSHKYVLA